MSRRQALRRYWLAVHLYAGVLLGGVFALLGITGSALVFYLGIDETLNPGIQVSRAVAVPPSPEAVLQQLRAKFPEREGPWRIEMPLTPDTPVMARYYKPPERADHFFSPLMVTLDPVTLDVTSHRFWGDSVVTWVYDLHYTLLLGESGRTAVGIFGLLMLLSIGTGLYLWWPSRQRFLSALRPALRQGVARRTYDLHVLGGVYSWLVVAVVALTGTALALPDQTRSVLGSFSALHGHMPMAAVLSTNAARLDLDAAVKIAQSRFPGAEVRWVETSGASGNPIFVRLHQPEEPGRRFPRTQVWLHPQTGEILAVRDPKQNSTGDAVLDWLHPLHNGEVFGFAGRLLVLLSGLVLPLIFVTGLIRWRQKVKARTRIGPV